LRQARYLRDDLGYRTDLACWEQGWLRASSGTADADADLAYAVEHHVHHHAANARRAGRGEGPPEPTPGTNAPRSSTRSSFLIGAGLYDALNSCEQRGAPPTQSDIASQFVLKCYLGGHGFRDPVTAAQFAADLRAFVRDTLAQRQTRRSANRSGRLNMCGSRFATAVPK
jgi:hypothetical protein